MEEQNIVTGIDGKKWIDKDCCKTGVNEPVPLLSICLKILERYKNHPVCFKTGRLLPVSTNQHYNHCLKLLAAERGITIVLRTHKARSFCK